MRQRLLVGTFNLVQVFARPGGLRGVPFDKTMRGRVIKSFECMAEFAAHFAHFFQQNRRVRIHVCETAPFDPTEQAHKALAAVGCGDEGDFFAFHRTHGVWNIQSKPGIAEPLHQGILKFEVLPQGVRVGDFQVEFFAGGRFEHEIQVYFASEGGSGGG